MSKRELRLLSLLPSATETIHALGLGIYQVGRSHECDYPPAVKGLPVCTRPAIDVSGSSVEIDRLVKKRLAAAVSIYDVDSSLLVELQPTHIVTQTQCKVCAVNLEDVELALSGQAGASVRLIAVESYSLSAVWKDIQRIAAACGCEMAGEELVESLQMRMQVIQAHAERILIRPTVGAIEWLDPLMAAGNWVPELIEMAAGQNLLGTAGQHSPWLKWDQLIAADPDILIAMPCGFDLERTRREIWHVFRNTDWRSLKAVQSGRVFICDGNQFLNRPGPRLVESLQILAEIIHPESFQPTLENVGWQRF